MSVVLSPRVVFYDFVICSYHATVQTESVVNKVLVSLGYAS